MDVNIVSSPILILALCSFTFLYAVILTVYRLYFHPLAKFPGPKLAAITYGYEIYWDVIKRGRYTWHLKDLHEKYGPIIRFNPNELHINDPSFYDEIYPSGIHTRVDKPYAHIFGTEASAFATVLHDRHRKRRTAINPFFSKRAITRLESSIQDVIDDLSERFTACAATGEVVNAQYAFTALTTDVINEYCFSYTYRAVQRADFNKPHYDSIMAFAEASNLTRHFPILFKVMTNLPNWLALKLNPTLATVIEIKKGYMNKIEEIIAGRDKSFERTNHVTIFHAILESDLPDSEKTAFKLRDTAQSLVAAGTFTVGHMLKTTIYHILANKSIYSHLLSEIDLIFPDPATPPPLSQLEALPYLSAVISEGLRLSYGVTKRLTRSQPDNSIQYHKWTIPRGTPVGMTSVLLHDNPATFPDPYQFTPERWLGDEGKRRQRDLVSFSKGSRSCVGINLAYAEMYKALACLLRRFAMELAGDVVRERDVDITRDFFNGSQDLGSTGLGIRIVEVRK